MNQHTRASRLALRVAAPAVGVVAVLAGTYTAIAQTREPVTDWARRNAVPLRTVDPQAPLDDVAALRGSIGDAAIVGLGESTHGAAEEEQLKLRTLRFLVEQLGYRTIAWEDDWTTGLKLDEYIRTGKGNLGTLVAQMSPQWPSREVADVLRWLRDYNAGHADKVRFFGVESYLTGQLAYDEVKAYVAKVDPRRLSELRSHLRVIRPPTADIFKYIGDFLKVDDKQSYVRHAREVRALVERLPHRPGDRGHAVALHNADQIVSFYEYYTMSEAGQFVYRDAYEARNLAWWRTFSGDKIVFWAASPHIANAPQLRITRQSQPDMRFASAGSYLRRWYGERYRAIGYTFDHGAISGGPGVAVPMPPPRQEWFEQPLGKVGLDQFALDLRRPAPPPVRTWLTAPIKTRGLPNEGPDAYMSGGTLAQWFDIVVHRQEVTPTQPV
ncbi:MAG TPA: erythromycin esterase family protein [Streptosporangiaceae bacterium]|jgi:erythromycin esterase